MNAAQTASLLLARAQLLARGSVDFSAGEDRIPVDGTSEEETTRE
jgi:hypothetical protein